MKAIIVICAAGLITGCADQSVNRWNEMWADIAIRHEYEKYSCASCARALEGYSKDAPASFSPRKRVRIAKQQTVAKTPSSNPSQENQDVKRNEDEIRALSAKIDVLEDALRTNAATTNVNQNLIVQQIIALKIQLAQLEKSSSTAPEK